ncbi:tyrosine-protein kinase receptor Tie-1-like [Glandiceps talaboti]
MAPESVLKKEFSTKSDVWSFGVVLWEVVTLGATPYEGISVADRVSSGYALPKPPQCGPQLNEMMTACMNRKQSKRPTFKILLDTINSFNKDNKKYINLQRLGESPYANLGCTGDK